MTTSAGSGRHIVRATARQIVHPTNFSFGTRRDHVPSTSRIVSSMMAGAIGHLNDRTYESRTILLGIALLFVIVPSFVHAQDRRDRFTAPTHADVAYGDHEKQAFDIWLAESKDGEPTPLVIFIHGGGFRGGDKRNISGDPDACLDQGISFASMNYRLSDVGPYPIMMHDGARGLQYIRSRAQEWNLDPERVACYGGSAGAGISLWLAFHEDLADPNSSDPVARQSTRIVAAGTQNGQSTYDMRTFREWFGIPNLKPHPALTAFYAIGKDGDWESDRVKKLMVDASAINHLTKDDPPVFMSYKKGDVPIDEDSAPTLWVHHVRLGLKLKEAMDALELECHVTSPDHPSQEYKDIHAFLRAKVLGTSE